MAAIGINWEDIWAADTWAEIWQQPSTVRTPAPSRSVGWASLVKMVDPDYDAPVEVYRFSRGARFYDRPPKKRL